MSMSEQYKTIILCTILECGCDDIDYMFDNVASGLLIDAINDCKCNGWTLSANNILKSVFEIAIERTFGEEMLEKFDIHTNCQDSNVLFLGDKAEVEDFDDKSNNFSEMTGFDIEEMD